MKELYQKYKLFFIILSLLIIGFLAWYFSQIVIFVIVAMVLSIIGSPLVERLDRLRIWKIRFPHGVSVTITLVIILAVFFGLFSFFIPLVIREAQLISSIDTRALADYYRPQIDWLESALVGYGFMPKEATFESTLKEMVLKLVDFGMFSEVFSSIVSFTGAFFFNLFSILFLTFFFLYDTKMMPRLILLLVPEKYDEKTRSVMNRSKKLLSRYFIGLIIQILLNITFYSIALTIIGVKGALVIAFFAGIIIIIPYLGGIIAVLTAVILGITGVISAGDYTHILPMTLKILIAMIAVQLIDNNLFQPFIQGKSVKAHPVEIFLVVIAAASIGGIPAMIVAVPAYGFLKIVATEFLSNFRIVQSMKEEEKPGRNK